MKVYARPIESRIRARNQKFSVISAQRMSSRHAYEIAYLNTHSIALSGFSIAHSVEYQPSDFTYEDVMGRKLSLNQAITLLDD